MSMHQKYINFYEVEYACLSNFSSHNVTYEGITYATAEHAYQCQKFVSIKMQQKIAKATSAFLAREYGQEERFRKMKFDKVAAMKEIMRSKLFQHNDVREILKKTGSKIIRKNHPLDSFWGTGISGKGKNVMGLIWMELRAELKTKKKA